MKISLNGGGTAVPPLPPYAPTISQLPHLGRIRIEY